MTALADKSKNITTMEGSSSMIDAPVSTARRRLRILAGTFIGITTLSLVGTGGYLAYKKIQDTPGIAEPASRSQKLVVSPSTLHSIAMTNGTQTAIAISTQSANASYSVPSQSSTLFKLSELPSPTKATMLTSHDKTSTVVTAITGSTSAITITSTKTSTTEETTLISFEATTLTSNKQTSLALNKSSSPIPTSFTSPGHTSTTVNTITSSPSAITLASPTHLNTIASSLSTTTVTSNRPTSTSETTSSSTETTTVTSTESTSTSVKTTPSSTETTRMHRATSQKITEQTSPSLNMTSISTEATSAQSCSTSSIAELFVNLSNIHFDPCLDQSSATCNNGSEIVPNYCECTADGIWTVIQRRLDGSVDFYRNWTEYKEGFGDLNCEYWLGNDAIHQITSNASYTLKVLLTDWDGETAFAMYDTFSISNEADGYQLTIGDYSGDAGDSLANYHNGHKFSTKDIDNGDYPDKKCAETYTGAWWYKSCYTSNLNGKYYYEPGTMTNGIIWFHWKGARYSLKETKMMIRRKEDTYQQTSTTVKATLATTIAATEQTSTTLQATSSSTKATSAQMCSPNPIEALRLNFSGINSDPCLDESATMCNNGSQSVPSFCECSGDDVWTIIQRRFDGSVNFYRNWTDYREGFGDVNCEYWLGNDAIHQITSTASYMLKIVLTDWDGVTAFAMYDTFRIADEADGYRLTIGGYSGDAGDSIAYHNGFMFSTEDEDNDNKANENCANINTGAWWYVSCYTSNLNGHYFLEPEGSVTNGIIWYHWKGARYSLKETTMMIKRKQFD